MQQQVPTFQKVHETVEVPCVMKRTVRTTQTVQKTVKAPQVQFFDRTEDVPVVTQTGANDPKSSENIPIIFDRIGNVPVVLEKSDSNSLTNWQM